MSQQIFINAQHPLSRFHVFGSLRVGAYDFRSVEQARWFCSLIQSGLHDDAHRLRQDAWLCREPFQCSTWVEMNHCYPDARWIIGCKDVYKDILLDQLNKPNSEFREAFFDAIIDLDGYRPEFVVCSGTNELVFSCGARENAVERREVLPGFNIYGEILDELFETLTSDVEPRWGVDNLLSVPIQSWNRGWPFPKAVLVLSDSFCRIINHIECGIVRGVSGGTFTDLIAASKSLRIEEFGIVIVQGGTNVAKKSELVRKVELLMVKDFLLSLTHGSNPPYILLSGALPVPGARNVPGFNSEVQQELANSTIPFVNWSMRDTFLSNGKFDERFLRFDHEEFCDGFHLGATGIRAMWQVWCEYLPMLRSVSYSLTPVPYKYRRRPQKRRSTGSPHADNPKMAKSRY